MYIAEKDYLFLKEFSVDDILSAVDPDFIHHKQYKAELDNLSDVKLEGMKGRHFKFSVKSSKYDKNHKIYYQHVLFKDIKDFLKDKELNPLEATNLVIEEGDITVKCSCPSFKFWGYHFINTELDSVYGRKETRPPNIRNPQENGAVCKHLHLVLDWFKENKDVAVAHLLLVVQGIYKELEYYF